MYASLILLMASIGVSALFNRTIKALSIRDGELEMFVEVGESRPPIDVGGLPPRPGGEIPARSPGENPANGANNRRPTDDAATGDTPPLGVKERTDTLQEPSCLNGVTCAADLGRVLSLSTMKTLTMYVFTGGRTLITFTLLFGDVYRVPNG